MCSVFDLVRKLQEKSRAARRRVGVAVAALVTIVIFLVWLSTFTTARAPAEQREESVRVATPLETIRDSFGVFVERLRGELPPHADE